MAASASSARRHAAPRRDRGVDFVRCNLELLGFGDAGDALVQTVKELFENALDAVMVEKAPSGEGRREEMVHIRVSLNEQTGRVDIVCADTGSGIHVHKIRQLCCGVFETTKGATGDASALLTCGKYGLGLKAAILYSQQNESEAGLKVVTTSSSNEIICIRLQIDPDADEPAIVHRLSVFSLPEAHRQFSGTEMRISIPVPASEENAQRAASMLQTYFGMLRYSIPRYLGVAVEFDLGTTKFKADLAHGGSSSYYFALNLDQTEDDIVYASTAGGGYGVQCMATLIGDEMHQPTPFNIEITLLRYANSVPLMDHEDFFVCALSKAILTSKKWKKLGYKCTRPPVRRFGMIATPKQTRRVLSETKNTSARLIVAMNVTAAGGNSIKYANLRKSALDKTHVKGAQSCFEDILNQLHETGKITTPQESRDEELIADYAPLVASAATGILNRSCQITARRNEDVPMECSPSQDSQTLTLALQEILHRVLSSHRAPSSFN